MSHRHGRASYSLLHDFWRADCAVEEFLASPELDRLPVGERKATYALLLNRRADARRAVCEGPPWILTPDEVMDGVAARTGAALERELVEIIVAQKPGETFEEALGRDFERFRDRIMEFVGAELRRVAFDARLAEGYLPKGPDRAVLEKSPPTTRLVATPLAIQRVVEQAARDHLGRFGISSDSPTYAERRERLEGFAFDVIARHERSKQERGWFGWFHRWKGGRV